MAMKFHSWNEAHSARNMLRLLESRVSQRVNDIDDNDLEAIHQYKDALYDWDNPMRSKLPNRLLLFKKRVPLPVFICAMAILILDVAYLVYSLFIHLNIK